jgi:hypothetical protein
LAAETAGPKYQQLQQGQSIWNHQACLEVIMVLTELDQEKTLLHNMQL